MWSVLRELTDLVLPATCAGCHRPGAALCARCRPAVGWLDAAGRRANADPRLAVACAAYYVGPTRSALVSYKERGRTELAGALAAALLLAVRVLTAGSVLLIPVPSGASASRRRGGDHVLRLARSAADQDAYVEVLRALSLRTAVRDSAGLSASQRRANMSAAFVCRAAGPAVAQCPPVVLVDDIITSGATLAAASTAVRAAGWPLLGAAVIAATPQHRDRVVLHPGQVRG